MGGGQGWKGVGGSVTWRLRLVEHAAHEADALEEAPGGGDVRGDGLLEGVHGFELFLGPQELEEEHADLLAIQLAGALEAPMPGRVTAVRAEAGQRVKRGEELLVVEAMKMENALHAPRDGVVRAVHVSPGDMVAPGRPLVELEAEG